MIHYILKKSIVILISYLLTSWKEPRTVGRAMEAIISQKNRSNSWELLMAAPDEETLDAARDIKNKHPDVNISVHQDEGKGKPAALNLLFSKARGDIWILTDGDVWMDEYATERLLEKFDLTLPTTHYPLPTSFIAFVSGHPVSINDRNTLLGFWSHLLTQSADYKRTKFSQEGKFFDASGYLFAVKSEAKRNLKLPEDILVDDSFISHTVLDNAAKMKKHDSNSLRYSSFNSNQLFFEKIIYYADDALVYVKFPTTFSDWMKQKIRSTGGYLQIQKLFPHHAQMRTFWQETLEFFIPLKFIKSPKEFFWLILLYFARLYLWLRIFIFYKLLKRSFSSGWPRIESTK